MNRLSKILLLVGVGLTLILPFASKSPDGLETVIKSLGVEEQTPLWSGLTNDFLVSIVGNSYIAVIINGLIGFFTVLAAVWLVGWVSFRRKKV